MRRLSPKQTLMTQGPSHNPTKESGQARGTGSGSFGLVPSPPSALHPEGEVGPQGRMRVFASEPPACHDRRPVPPPRVPAVVQTLAKVTGTRLCAARLPLHFTPREKSARRAG